MTPFDWFNQVTQKTGTDVDLSDWNTFMVNRIASMNKRTVWIADEMNKNTGLTSQQVFDFYYNMMPKGKVYNKYIKSSKGDEVLDIIQQVYKISAGEARSYVDLLTDEDIAHLRDYLFTGGVEQKKSSKATKS